MAVLDHHKSGCPHTFRGLRKILPKKLSNAHTSNGLLEKMTNLSNTRYLQFSYSLTSDMKHFHFKLVGFIFGRIYAVAHNLLVESSKTYLLKIINAAINEELFFKIAGPMLSLSRFKQL